MIRRTVIVLSFVLLSAASAAAETQGEAPGTTAAGIALHTKSNAESIAASATDGSSPLQRMMSGITLGGLLLLAMLGGWKKISEKRRPAGPENQIEVIARRGLTQKTALLVVRVDGRRYFLAQGAESVSLISELDDPAMLFEADGDEAYAAPKIRFTGTNA